MIRIGVIGAGPMGAGNAQKLASHAARCQITAVVDPNPAAAQKLAQLYSAKTAGELSDILHVVDAIIISSPNFLHVEQAVAAAQAGKHIFIEKPMALTVADADQIVQAVDQARVASLVGFSVRFDGTVRRMKELVTTGQMGDLVSLWSRRLSYFEPAKGWRTEYSKSGGVMAELMAHEIDWMVDIAGVPSSVYCRKASRNHNDPRDNDHIWLTMNFGPETCGTIEGSQMSAASDYARGIVGSQAAAVTRYWGKKLQFCTPPNGWKDLDDLPDFDKHGHFLDVIEGKCASVADVHYGRRIVRISEQAIASAVTGNPLSI